MCHSDVIGGYKEEAKTANEIVRSALCTFLTENDFEIDRCKKARKSVLSKIAKESFLVQLDAFSQCLCTTIPSVYLQLLTEQGVWRCELKFSLTRGGWSQFFVKSAFIKKSTVKTLSRGKFP